jgi:selenocysteine lyase/cysteine desulfurase
VRRERAHEAGVDPECLAITRNASEALQIVQLGLDLQPGDEVLTTDQDYPRMLNTWAQRVKRDGIVLRRVSFPVPCDAATFQQRILEQWTSRTKVLHLCHIVNLTGQILPIQALCAEARARGAFSVVDGAHAFAQWPYSISELGCDAYGTSLHKWLLAPVGTGFLYLRKERIREIWPLTPAGLSQSGDIRKFEEIGTHPAANHDAVAEALVFHRGIGAALKAERLRVLRRRWTDAVRDLPKIRLLTSDDPALSCGIGTVGIEGADIGAAVSTLWSRWRIVATPITHAPADPTDPDAKPYVLDHLMNRSIEFPTDPEDGIREVAVSYMRLAVVAILRGGRARRGHGDTIPFPDLYRSCHTLPPGIGFAERFAPMFRSSRRLALAMFGMSAVRVCRRWQQR